MLQKLKRDFMATKDPHSENLCPLGYNAVSIDK
jgi:hypothetical protein